MWVIVRLQVWGFSAAPMYDAQHDAQHDAGGATHFFPLVESLTIPLSILFGGSLLFAMQAYDSTARGHLLNTALLAGVIAVAFLH